MRIPGIEIDGVFDQHDAVGMTLVRRIQAAELEVSLGVVWVLPNQVLEEFLRRIMGIEIEILDTEREQAKSSCLLVFLKACLCDGVPGAPEQLSVEFVARHGRLRDRRRHGRKRVIPLYGLLVPADRGVHARQLEARLGIVGDELEDPQPVRFGLIRLSGLLPDTREDSVDLRFPRGDLEYFFRERDRSLVFATPEQVRDLCQPESVEGATAPFLGRIQLQQANIFDAREIVFTALFVNLGQPHAELAIEWQFPQHRDQRGSGLVGIAGVHARDREPSLHQQIAG